jgi:hypothetical protein
MRKINVFVGVFVILAVFKLIFVTKVNAVLIQYVIRNHTELVVGVASKNVKVMVLVILH